MPAPVLTQMRVGETKTTSVDVYRKLKLDKRRALQEAGCLCKGCFAVAKRGWPHCRRCHVADKKWSEEERRAYADSQDLNRAVNCNLYEWCGIEHVARPNFTDDFDRWSWSWYTKGGRYGR